jgi:ribosomal protein L22
VAEPKKTTPDARAAAEEAAATAAEVKAQVAAEKADSAAEASAEQAEAEEQVAEDAAAEEAAEEQAAEEPAAEEQAEKKPAARRRSRRKAPEAEEAAEPKAAARTREPGERPVVRAQARYVRTSARKARLVCDHIRGKSVPEARAILAHTPRAVAADWEKLLASAVANAEHNHELIGDELRILTVTADEGPTLKRFRPRARGMASRIRKRTSHLTITLTPGE